MLGAAGICDEVEEGDSIGVGHNAVDERHHSPQRVAVRRYHHVNSLVWLLSNHMVGHITKREHFFHPISELEIWNRTVSTF